MSDTHVFVWRGNRKGGWDPIGHVKASDIEAVVRRVMAKQPSRWDAPDVSLSGSPADVPRGCVTVVLTGEEFDALNRVREAAEAVLTQWGTHAVAAVNVGAPLFGIDPSCGPCPSTLHTAITRLRESLEGAR